MDILNALVGVLAFVFWWRIPPARNMVARSAERLWDSRAGKVLRKSEHSTGFVVAAFLIYAFLTRLLRRVTPGLDGEWAAITLIILAVCRFLYWYGFFVGRELIGRSEGTATPEQN